MINPLKQDAPHSGLTYRHALEEAIENMAKTRTCLTLFDQAIEEARSLAVYQFLSGDRTIGPQLQQAKKDAMRDAADIVLTYNRSHDHGAAATHACNEIEALLRAHCS